MKYTIELTENQAKEVQGTLDFLGKYLNFYTRLEPIEDSEMYQTGLNDASDLLAYADERFIRECFPGESNWNLFDLMKKYGLEVITKEYKKWQEQKKQYEEEIKLGDVVCYKENPESEFFVFKIKDNLIGGINTRGIYDTRPMNEWTRTGKNFFELVRYVNKAFSIKGENQDE